MKNFLKKQLIIKEFLKVKKKHFGIYKKNKIFLKK